MSRQSSHSPGFLLDPPSLLTLDVAPGSSANPPPSTLAHFWAAASSLNHTPPHLSPPITTTTTDTVPMLNSPKYSQEHTAALNKAFLNV